MTIILVTLPQKLLLKPWYMKVYLRVEWIHLNINDIISGFKTKIGNPPQESSKNSTPIKDMYFLEQINLPTTWLIGEPMEA